APMALTRRHKRKVVVVFDEVQRILEYESDAVERHLRSIVQRQEGVSYIFLGSRKHLVQKMFLDRSRPLYRAAGHYPLGPILTKDWLPFVQEKFRQSGKQISGEMTRFVCEMTEGHPFYTQHLCHVVWELCDAGAEVRPELLRKAVKVLLNRESYAYTALWDSLTLGQRRFLTGLASEDRGAKAFSSAFFQRYGVGTASNAQRAAKALMARDLIDRDNGSFVIADRFFRLWIQQMSMQ
ncbi:MAG: AAA family ATPase, partial [Terriglobia bacterium]